MCAYAYKFTTKSHDSQHYETFLLYIGVAEVH